MSYAHDLWLMVASQYLVFGLIWMIAARNRHTPENGLEGIGWFNVLLGLGLALGVLRGALPFQSARTGANLLQISAFVVAWIQTSSVLELPPRRREVITVAVAASALVVWMGVTAKHGNERVAVCFATLGYILVRIAILAFRPLVQRHGRGIASVVLAVSITIGVVLLAQAIGGFFLEWPLEVDHQSERSLMMAYGALFGMATLNSLLGYWVLRSVLRELERLTLHDTLTGLANRRCLFQRLEQEWHRWSRSGAGFAVICLDVDHFKSVNDRYGHPTGDRVLVTIGGTIGTILRPTDLAARSGGEEFVVVLEDVDNLDRAIQVAERLRGAIEALPVSKDGLPRPITISLGAALVEAADAGVASVMERADAALYRAKQSGRNRVELAPPQPALPLPEALPAASL